VEFEWDPAKDVVNEAKHGISFEDAKRVFEDPQHLVEQSTARDYGEPRRLAIGRFGSFVITVIFTDRHEIRRIISARRARRNERERYRQSAESA
jgi:uncharacterized DUF497 family protein